MVTDRREDIMEKRIVKEQKENEEYRWRIMDALEDINLFMEWHLGGYTRKGYRDDG